MVAEPQVNTPARPALEPVLLCAIERDSPTPHGGEPARAWADPGSARAGHVDVEREPLQERAGLRVIEQRTCGRGAPCDERHAPVVGRVGGVERQVVLRRGHRDGVLLDPVDVDDVVDADVLARPVADVAHVDGAEHGVAPERASQSEPHRIRVEEHRDLRQTLVERDRRAHVLGAGPRHEPRAISAQRTRSSTCSGQFSRKTRNGIEARRSRTQVRNQGTPAGCRP